MKDNYEYQYYCQPWFYVIYIKQELFCYKRFYERGTCIVITALVSP